MIYAYHRSSNCNTKAQSFPYMIIYSHCCIQRGFLSIFSRFFFRLKLCICSNLNSWKRSYNMYSTILFSYIYKIDCCTSWELVRSILWWQHQLLFIKWKHTFFHPNNYTQVWNFRHNIQAKITEKLFAEETKNGFSIKKKKKSLKI